jgi:polar amino acid transport system ATP-binding protein
VGPDTHQSSLELQGITKSFGANRVLRGIDLTVRRGHTVCVIGPSGSGKSTMLRCVNRLEEPTSGRVVLDGVDMTAEDPDKLRRRVGMVFQHFNLFPHKTVADNIMLPLRNVRGMSKADARARALERLEDVGLAHKADFRPASLSGGQQQRVAIARALINQPVLLLADEPTGALDTHSGEQVMELIEGLNREGQTVLLVTHDAKLATRHAGRVVTLIDGRVDDDTRFDGASPVPASVLKVRIPEEQR